MAGVSHELRTPITNLKIYHRLLSANPDKSAEYLQIIDKSTQRLETIVEQMLYITRMYRELDTLASTPVNLNSLVENALPEHMEMIKKRNLNLSFEAQPDLPTIDGDPNLLTRVLHNLLDNAASYTPKEAEIAIKTTTQQIGDNKPCRRCG